MNPESNDPQLERVRREIRAQAAVLHERPLQVRKPPPASGDTGRIEQARLNYRIGELTGAHYRAFIEQAFQALLKRAPDPAERDAQIALLAAGATKAEVLGNLRWSPEGRRVGVRVAGLLPRYASAKARRVPVLGYVLDLLINLAGLPQLARHQRASDALMAAGDEAAAVADHMLSTRINDVSAGHRRSLDELAAARDVLHQRGDVLAHELGIARETLTQAIVELEGALRTRIETLENASHTHAARFEELEFLRRRLHAMNRWSEAVGQAFSRIDEVADARIAARHLLATPTAQAIAIGDFARTARNSRLADRFADSIGRTARVLALACASDWPELLQARGLDVMDAGFDDAASDTDRTVRWNFDPGRARELLARCEEGSVDGFTILAMAALIRELPAAELLAEARRVLRPGGVALFALGFEPAATVDALLSGSAAVISMDLLEYALPHAGFVELMRLDDQDGSSVLLARRAVD